MYVADLGMYYVHGRWWRTDLGIFISPAEESGEYRYGSGQDPVNWAWRIDQNLDSSGGGARPDVLEDGIEAHLLIQFQCIVKFGLDCKTEVPIDEDHRPDIIIQSRFEVYEIKPHSQYGLSTGPTQLEGYLDTLGPPYQKGTTWKPYFEMSSLVGGNKTLRVFTRQEATYRGIIFYVWLRRARVPVPSKFFVPVLDPLLVPQFNPGFMPEISPIGVSPSGIPIPVIP